MFSIMFRVFGSPNPIFLRDMNLGHGGLSVGGGFQERKPREERGGL